MQRRTFLRSCAGGVAVAFPWRLPAAADLVLVNGLVHTLDPRHRRVAALAVGGGRIMAAGSTAAIRKLAGTATRVIDLAGQSVIPGINDAHFHAAYWGLSQPPFSVDVGYPAVKSIADAVAAVGRAVAAKRPGEWIQGRGWDMPYFAEGRAPTRQDLDRVAPDNPVILTEFSGHAVWVNSKALALAGITRETVPPQGGVVVKDADGEPTGVLFEGAAGLVRRKVPPATPAEQRAGYDLSMKWMLAQGITSYTEPGTDPASIAMMAERVASGALGPRITVLMQGGRSAAAVRNTIAGAARLPQTDAAWLRVAGVKLYADGIPTNNKTAWMYEPYVGGGTGKLVVDGDTDEARSAELQAMVTACHEAGWQIGTHVTGDRGIDAVVAALTAAMAATPRPDPRHYLIHSDLVPRATLAAMAKHGIGANFNASIKHLIADGQVGSIGPERAAYEWPFRTALDAGVHLSNGSDAPVTDGSWRQGLATCVDRKGKQSGTVSGPDQRISFEEALRTFTTGGAWQDRAESWKGTLAPGMAADLCVLDGDIAAMEPAGYPSLKVTLTMVGGRVAE